MIKPKAKPKERMTTMPDTLDDAKVKWGYCFDSNEGRVEAAIEELGLPAAIGLIAAQMADAFEAGFAAAQGRQPVSDKELRSFLDEIAEMTGPDGEIYGHR